MGLDHDCSTVEQAVTSSPSRKLDSEVVRDALARAGLTGFGLPVPGPGTEVGRYILLGTLGEGGMGMVYTAYDPQLDRNVALKLLRRVIDDEADAELRLLREAQMLAQLQHPNVVAVYDSGLTRYGVFIAMELLDGDTLREWLERRARKVAELLAVFRAAGEGLAAAHDAGFVHRDFKPSNVMVGGDGSVRVLDFGVASLMVPQRGSDDEASSSATLGEHRVVRPSGAVEPLSRSDLQLTDEGCVVGTPPYMAPEQVAGDRVDHRSDQFTFCVCLHLALYGHSPVIGEGFEERRWNMSRGRVLDERGMLTGRTPGRVPARVRRVLRRGLSVDPADRFPSMRALLHELREPPRRWPLVVAGPMLALGFAAGMVFDIGVDPCAEQAMGLEHEWGEEQRRAVREAFARSGHAQADELRERVEEQLDRYAAAWTEMYVESCQATFVEQQQSEQLHDQRLRCLERRRNRVRGAVHALSTIEDGQQALDRTVLPFLLPMIADCADLEAVSTTLPLPEEPGLRRSVQALRRSIDEVEIMKAAGDFRRGLPLARAVVDRAQQTQFPPVIAEALESLGSMQAMGGSAREAQATLERAILEAARAGDDATAAKAWTWLIHALVMQQQLELGRSRELAARAAVKRAADEQLRGWLLNNLGALHGAAHDYERSLALLEEALHVKQQVLGPEHVDVGISWYNLGAALLEHGRYHQAQGALERARATFEATVGSAHPLTFHAMGGLCQVRVEQEDHDAAVELCGRVLAHYELSPTAPVTMGHHTYVMAKALRGAGRREEALALGRRALTLVQVDAPMQAQEIQRWLEELERDQPEPRSARRRR